MDLRFTPDELRFREQVREFFRQALPTDLRDKCLLGQRLSKPEMQRWTRILFDKGWATLTQLENAGAMLGAKEGVFTPSQFLNAVKKSDKSLRDRAFARGQARNEKFAQAALMYKDNPIALHLRAMNMLYEAIKEKGSMVIVPSSAVETMGLGGMIGTTALSKLMGDGTTGSAQ